MCSITGGSTGDPAEGSSTASVQRIAEIGQAIEDLATKAGPTVLGDTDPIVARVAELWGLLAELDPDLARRLAGYQALLKTDG
jgi:hypothetical protein